MRESNYSYPPQNRAVLSITHLLYDRRALDTNSPLAILNNLTSLTYLTQTSPRIREILTLDGGLERLLDILRDSCLPREIPVTPDSWGLNGPPTARVINVDRQVSLRHSLAFQCVVNIGVRGTEAIRTRVVQAGALDLVAQILESWLQQHEIAILAGPVGSQGAVDAQEQGLPVPGTDGLQRTSRSSNSRHNHASSGATVRASSISQFVQSLTGTRPIARITATDTESIASEPRASDTDVDMADAEGDEGTDTASLGAGDDSMDLDEAAQGNGRAQMGEEEPQAGPSTTPRAQQTLLPMAINIPSRALSRDRREVASQASSAGNSLAGDDVNTLPRATSENNLAAAVQAPRPPPLNLGAARLPQLAQDPISNQSSPMGTPTRNENVDGMRTAGRRGTIVGRPMNVNLAPRNDRRNARGIESGTSDAGSDVDLPAATIAAGIAAANAQAMETGGTIVPDEPGPPPNVEIVDNAAGLMVDDPDPEAMAAEQARLDMEAGAPPGQPGAAQTPRAPTDNAVPPPVDADPNQQPTQIIIANGAPRGFQDLGSYVGISSLLNPDGDHYSDDSILLSLQLLAYLSKYPHVRSAFHHPRRPMHPTFNLGIDYIANPLPERPAVSQTPNIFSLVERFTFRPSPSDPLLFRVPQEIQYWAGVIMRNACRKDEAQGGIRQCANMTCGRWESFPREFAKCRRCRKAKYCSKNCQSKAWSDGHRFWCNTRTDDGPPGQGSTANGPGPGGGRPPEDGGDDEDHDFDGGDRARDASVRAAGQGLAGAPGGERNGRPVFTFGPTTHQDSTDSLTLQVQMDLLNETLNRRNEAPHQRAATGIVNPTWDNFGQVAPSPDWGRQRNPSAPASGGRITPPVQGIPHVAPSSLGVGFRMPGEQSLFPNAPRISSPLTPSRQVISGTSSPTPRAGFASSEQPSPSRRRDLAVGRNVNM